MAPTEVFLWHASADVDYAAKVADVLRAHQIRVFFSPHHIRAAAQWHDVLGNALLRYDWFAVLLSPAAVESMWVNVLRCNSRN